MKKILFIKITCFLIITPLLIINSSAYSTSSKQKTAFNLTDYDPLVDIYVTVDIQKIRSLEKFDYPHPRIKIIDWFSWPDFFVIVTINNKEFKSDTWENTRYIYNPQFSATSDVPDDVENVSIKIQIFDWNSWGNKICDLSGDSKFDVLLTYSIKTGHWTGGDFVGDPSGYKRLNGCDDGSIYKFERDCELWFDVYQTDFDGDKIPYWTEVYVYGTDPNMNNIGDDDDADGVPIESEWQWGFDPFKKDSHNVLDPDIDGLNNYEEFLTFQWGSDPFRQDIFIELDCMEESPDGIKSNLPERAKELLNTAFDRYNKVLHIDDGCMGGGEIIPFDNFIDHDEIYDLYWRYFLHYNQNNWRKGVFHYSLIVYDPDSPGFTFRPNAFVISSKVTEEKTIPKTEMARAIVYASCYMHETGHTLAISNPGVDNRDTYFPWQKGFWIWGNYKSCMNYRYVYRLVDYSDGSRKINDFNDWEDMDLTAFQRPW